MSTASMESARLLFVYGTLRRNTGHPMSRLLAERARFLGGAKVPGRLYDLGAYPGMTEPAGANDWVVGELFELADTESALPILDEYEGVKRDPPLFVRRLIQATPHSGELLLAWAYLYRGPLQDARRIAGGDYRGDSPGAGTRPGA